MGLTVFGIWPHFAAQLGKLAIFSQNSDLEHVNLYPPAPAH